MNIEDIKTEVIYSEDQNRLFEITVMLTEEISAQHILLIKAADPITKAQIKAKISLLTTLQGIIDKRLPDIRTAEIYLNRRFRAAADLLLKKETYERLRQFAGMPAREMKQILKQNKDNKIE